MAISLGMKTEWLALREERVHPTMPIFFSKLALKAASRQALQRKYWEYRLWKVFRDYNTLMQKLRQRPRIANTPTARLARSAAQSPDVYAQSLRSNKRALS